MMAEVRSDDARQVGFRVWIYELLEDEDAPPRLATIVRRILLALIVLSVAVAIIDTMPAMDRAAGTWLRAIEHLCVAVFTVEYALRVWTAVEDRAGRYADPLWGRLRYMATPMAIIDLIAILPYFVGLLLPVDLVMLRALRVLRILKVTRYSRALATFEVVLVNERRSLMAAASIMAIALLLASALLYHAERDAQPDAFGSIPAAMWYAVITLTAVGYGDVVPITPLGRVIGGLTAVTGILMLALPTAILGAGFTQEIQKRNFATTAAMVSRVPLFRHLAPPQLAELTSLLRPRVLPARYTVMRVGDHPDYMYFVDEGRVVLRYKDRRIELGPGASFGEMALLEGTPRQITIVTLSSCRLLELHASDLHRLLGADPTLRKTLLDEARRRLGMESV